MQSKHLHTLGSEASFVLNVIWGWTDSFTTAVEAASFFCFCFLFQGTWMFRAADNMAPTQQVFCVPSESSSVQRSNPSNCKDGPEHPRVWKGASTQYSALKKGRHQEYSLLKIISAKVRCRGACGFLPSSLRERYALWGCWKLC